MNLFEINRILAEKLNQSFESLYSLPYYEYLQYLDFLVKESGPEVNQVFEIKPGSD